MENVAIALGSNIEPRVGYLREAVLSMAPCMYAHSLKCSRLYESEPAEGANGGSFLNAVISMRTTKGPHELLAQLQDIEARLDRQRPFPNAARTIDLDLLFYGGHIHQTRQLWLPHPAMARRAFVLKPLLDIGWDEPHPQRHMTIEQLDARLTARIPNPSCHPYPHPEWPPRMDSYDDSFVKTNQPLGH